MKTSKIVRLTALVLLVASCAPERFPPLQIRSSSLDVEASITSFRYHSDDGLGKYYADLTISNVSNISRPYSNSWLWLVSGDTLRARTYSDSVASQIIDAGTVEIAAGEVLELKVYWPFPITELNDESEGLFVLEMQPES